MKAKYKNNSKSNLLLDNRSKMYVPITPDENWREEVQNLRSINKELKEKQEIYIDKLIKLQEGVEKQHAQFTNLQDLYNELFISYKKKEEEIAELQQLYRQSDRNHRSSERRKLQNINENNLRDQILEKQQEIQELTQKSRIQQLKFRELEQKMDKLLNENLYYKNKQKMNDSRASLESKVIEQLEEWQRQADTEKQAKIKIEYENQFLKYRNSDLQQQIKELQRLLSQRQGQILKLRQNNISLHRQSVQSRRSRSSSKSPRKNKENIGIDKNNRILDQLYKQNQNLKQELERYKNPKKSQQILENISKGSQYIQASEFFSFSKDDKTPQTSRDSPKLHEEQYDFQSLPPQLQIDNLIQNKMKRQ